jgi:hypothetical protein
VRIPEPGNLASTLIYSLSITFSMVFASFPSTPKKVCYYNPEKANYILYIVVNSNYHNIEKIKFVAVNTGIVDKVHKLIF